MSSIVLEARDIRYRYPRGQEAIRGISFHFRRGEKIALVGPNGAGKSTLLQMFNGMIRPDSGMMLFDNRPMEYDRASLRELRRKVGFVLQNPDRQIIAPTVYQDVAFGPTNLGYSEAEVRESVTTALRHVGLAGFERRPPHQLSGGEKKRVAIAGVLAMDPDVLVFDEPTSGLDPSGSEDLMELLDELNHEGKTIVISTHDVELAYPWADRVILLADGQIIKEDIPDVAFGNTKFVRMAHLSVPTLLELSAELEKRGFFIPGRKPRSVLDMVHIIESQARGSCCHPAPGTITVCNVDTIAPGTTPLWVQAHPGIAVGAMGTRAKQCAAMEQVALEFTYGVIDKCILRALRGKDSLILTNGSMVGRVTERVEAYCKESGNVISVALLETTDRLS
ncbi:energy-coupling factor ABC transporter ATP-binding protein [Methanoregula formicica]|uniref:ABC transporter ATP-binding protein n=1 Tax=Methanoregula formicica (strain DSM 22288 / NBRC 105244 / SMSP) TaxID=593750 RepID=L0HB65_METFS|nr:ATP-binding cassette domain-containing protein [Methanoregula formicica]AGB01992.1 cobalt transport protein ATP-binding subunit [Methanoregula formicica SMSP]